MYRTILSGVSLDTLQKSFGSNDEKLLDALEKRAESITDDEKQVEKIKSALRGIINGDILPQSRYAEEVSKRKKNLTGLARFFSFLAPKDPRFFATEYWHFSTAVRTLTQAVSESIVPKEEEHDFLFLADLEKKYMKGCNQSLRNVFFSFLYGRPLFGTSFDDRDGTGWYGYLTNQEGRELLAAMQSLNEKEELPEGSERFIHALDELISQGRDVWAEGG